MTRRLSSSRVASGPRRDVIAASEQTLCPRRKLSTSSALKCPRPRRTYAPRRVASRISLLRAPPARLQSVLARLRTASRRILARAARQSHPSRAHRYADDEQRNPLRPRQHEESSHQYLVVGLTNAAHRRRIEIDDPIFRKAVLDIACALLPLRLDPSRSIFHAERQTLNTKTPTARCSPDVRYRQKNVKIDDSNQCFDESHATMPPATAPIDPYPMP